MSLQILFFAGFTVLIVGWPLRSAHAAMVAYRNRMQRWVAAQANRLMEEVVSSPSDPTRMASNLETLQRLGQVESMYVERLPTWPIRPAGARRVSVETIVFPTLWVLYLAYNVVRAPLPPAGREPFAAA